MNWRDFIDKQVGDKRTFTADEVRKLLSDALKFECDNWVSRNH